MSQHDDGHDQGEPRVVIRDKRRIDPESGQVRPVPVADVDLGVVDPQVFEAPALDLPAAESAQVLRTELDERTGDLQRVKAEYDNFRKRVDRDRVAVAEQAQGAVLSQLVPVLDDIDRARTHGEVTGGFKVVADALDAAVAKVGLLRFGVEGDPFDPALHEAVMHSESPDVDGPTCVTVMRAGYLFRDRLVRPAMVAVAEPAHSAPGQEETLDDALTIEDVAGG